ncbi:MAG: winged helix-turn-helix transcriptional regulator [Chloroflexi bacterium]|nr:winged helix-turn-helix transcriptional regulator [Chloroflexota bacterium]
MHIFILTTKEGVLLVRHNPELYNLKAELCKTFADPKRLIIIDELREGERTVGELARVVELPQAVVSRHLAILRDRGVVQHRREGTSVYYSLSDPKIGDACDMVHQILLDQIEKNKQLAERLVA